MPHPVPSAAPREAIDSGAAGGLLLIAAAGLALVAANGPLAPRYLAAIGARLGPLTAGHWINDGLMALFFLLAGLEIKRELAGGHLARPENRRLPIAAALAGMAAPALLYLVATHGHPALARGWAIPAATDIAFAVGILALAGPRVPPSLRVFLTTVAIVDDIGAVAIIALAYTHALHWAALACAAAILAGLIALNRSGVRRLSPYLALAGALWVAVMLSGIHATVAGVLAAFAIPAAPDRDGRSPLDRLETALAWPVTWLVVPLFAFANAGVPLAGAGSLLAPPTLAVALALFLGKQAGVFGAIRLAIATGIAQRPADASWAQLYGIALLCGIGFTMSLFIGALAFADPILLDRVKLGVLAGSTLSAIAGFLVLRFAIGGPPRTA